MNGALGDERYGFSSTERTVNRASASPSASATALASSSAMTLAGHLSTVAEVLAGRDPCATDRDELRVEGRSGGGPEVDVPVVGGDVRDAFAFALDDEPNGRALDAPGRQAAVDASPQHRRHLVAVEAVEDAAGLGGVDEPVVEATRVVDGVVDGRLGDLVEHHPLHGHLRLEVLEEMPRDGFTLAVLVRCEVELRSVLQGGLQILDDGLAALGELVGGLEPVVDVDVQPLRRQVADVAHRGAHVVVAAEELRQRLGLGGRLHDDERFGHRCLSLGDRGAGCQARRMRCCQSEVCRRIGRTASRVRFGHDVGRDRGPRSCAWLGRRFRRVVAGTRALRGRRDGCRDSTAGGAR